METKDFNVSQIGSVATITLNRPAKMNALTQSIWHSLIETAGQLCDDATVHAILLTGSGGNFCAGADIGEFDTVRHDAETAKAYEALNAAAFAALRNATCPTIAAISGVCFGGGFGLAAACDLRIAADDALFSVPAARLGLAYPMDAMGDIVRATGVQMARYLTYSGARINARQAYECGFLLEIVPQKALQERAMEIAQTIAGNAPMSIRSSRAAIAAVLSGRTEDHVHAQALGDATFESADYAEGRRAFKERRKPDFSGK